MFVRLDVQERSVHSFRLLTCSSNKNKCSFAQAINMFV